MKRKLVLLPTRFELLIVAVSLFVLALIDTILYVFVLPQDFFADRIVSNWNAVRGDSTFSLGTELMLLFNIFFLLISYLSLRSLFVKLYRRQNVGLHSV